MQAAPPPPQVDRPPPPPPSIPHASSTIPWSAHEIEIAPPPSYWAFNPSVIRTPDGRWLCAVRCANYHLDADAGGKATVPVAGPVSPSGEPLAPVPLGRVMPKTVYNRSFMVTLDPRSLRAIADVEMHELDGLPRVPVIIRGYDDVRLTWTAQDGLTAIANVAHFRTEQWREMCALKLDERYQIVDATPLRGSWSDNHQKNWTPFVGTSQLRMLFSVERGGIHTRTGQILKPRPRHVTEVDPTIGTHPSIYAGAEKITLRGGTQLIRIAPHPNGRWLALAHGVSEAVGGIWYWHVWYSIDDDGQLLSRSDPMKLSDGRIEFAAGLALDPDTGRLVVSYGVGDDHCMLGVTKLEAVMKILKPVKGRRP